MFSQLGERLQATFKQLRSRGRLTEANIGDALREIRVALLEADVALPVARQLIDQVRARAVGKEVMESLTPGQAVTKVVYEELVQLMGESNDALTLNVRPPAVVLLAGLQGAGKTTTAAKLARFITERQQKKPLLVSCDVYRPAAIAQLEQLAEAIGAGFFPSSEQQAPTAIAAAAIEHARRTNFDVVIVDSAGRLHVDDAMMQEIREIHAAVMPVETLFVVDSMAGQDAVNSANAFNDALPLTGVILTKTDGDARGGAALSIRHVTGKPIKFLGIGEASDALEPFHPDRVASRILGMGDVLSLVEEVERTVDREQAEKVAKKLSKGKGFDLADFREQLEQMEKMGGIASLLDKLPGAGAPSAPMAAQLDDKQTRRIVAIINSMTPHERSFPAVVRGPRKRRIAAGSGTEVQDVNRLLKQFTQMQKMMKRMSKRGNMAKALGGFKGRMPGMPF